MTEPDKVIRKRILLADDQQEVRELTKMLLGMDDHIVTEAVNKPLSFEDLRQAVAQLLRPVPV